VYSLAPARIHPEVINSPYWLLRECKKRVTKPIEKGEKPVKAEAMEKKR
jgi:hypothetical protein